jgi:two-component system cell cycle sensor histidine kinase/response regulator CckA
MRGGGERILLVEDEEGLRRVAQRALEKVGYQVLTASDGQEALDRYRQNAGEFDLIITDVMMPRLGGVALHQLLRQEGHDVPFLFMSGYSTPVLPVDQAGGELVLLPKPWTLADLTRRVREVLDQPRAP